MKERRYTNRFPCNQSVCYSQGDQWSEGQLKDISLEGARLGCSSPLTTGQALEIVGQGQNGGQPVNCWVQWSSPNNELTEVGLQFRGSVGEVLQTWVGPLLRHRDGLLQKRELVRVPVNIRLLVCESGITVNGTLVDLSLGGGLIRCGSMFSTGSRLTLTLDELDLEATVLSGRFVDDSWHYSVRFEKLTRAQSRRLEEFQSMAIR